MQCKASDGVDVYVDNSIMYPSERPTAVSDPHTTRLSGRLHNARAVLTIESQYITFWLSRVRDEAQCARCASQQRIRSCPLAFGPYLGRIICMVPWYLE
jgi:hypothetical protein